jgi:hypothetical protein
VTRENARPELREPRPTVHLPFERFESIDLTFALAAAHSASTVAFTAQRSFVRPHAKRTMGRSRIASLVWPVPQMQRIATDQRLAGIVLILRMRLESGHKAVQHELLGRTESIQRSRHQDGGMLRRNSLNRVRLYRPSGFSPTGNELGHHGAASPISQLASLLEERVRIAATLCPLVLEVVGKGVNLWTSVACAPGTARRESRVRLIALTERACW